MFESLMCPGCTLFATTEEQPVRFARTRINSADMSSYGGLYHGCQNLLGLLFQIG